jgi:IS5 family transposase
MFVIWSHGTGFIMSHQLTFADSEFSSKRRQTRKEIFLSRMEQILPWQNMVEVIEPFYPRLVMAGDLIRWKPCYAFTACSIGTT